MGEGKFKQLIQYRFPNDERLITGGPDMPYVTGDTNARIFGGVLEPYWINTNGYVVIQYKLSIK